MGVIIVFLIIFIYFIPSINAYSKKKKNAGAVFALNFFLGWTFIGWVVALVWSATDDNKEVTVVHPKNTSGAEEIEKLAELKSKGVISEEEFNLKKKKILEAS